MRRLYKILIALIFIYAVTHMAYTFFYGALINSESVLWFFSGGLVMLFNGFINVINLRQVSNFTRYTSIAANLALLVFLIVLAFVVPEVQVFVLVLIVLLTLVIAGFMPASEAGKKKYFEIDLSDIKL